jgi:hypothetical protein
MKLAVLFNAQYSEEVKVVTVGTVFQVMVARIYGLEK